MLNSSVLDVAIGLIMVFLILGLMCTTVNEWIAQCFNLRAKTLEKGLHNLLAGHPGATLDKASGMAQSFFEHSLVKSLARKGKVPSYIPNWVFSAVVADLLSKEPLPANANPQADPLDQVIQVIEGLPESDLKRSLLAIAKNSDQISTFQQSLETWYEDAMDRVSGWYKKRLQTITIAVACGITIFANADTVQIARSLFLNPTEREKIVQTATSAKETGPLTDTERAALGEISGWSSEFRVFHQMEARRTTQDQTRIDAAARDDSFPGFHLVRDQDLFWSWLAAVAPQHLLGWLLTAIAASLGAPFWFDTLNKFMNIRSAGTAPNEKAQDSSKA